MLSNKIYAIMHMCQNRNTILSSQTNDRLIKWANNFAALKQQDKVINTNIMAEFN